MKNNIKILYFIFIVLFIVILFKFRDVYTFFLEKILVVNDKTIVFKDDFTNNYINYLEDEIKSFKELDNTSCVNASVIYRNPSIWYDEFIINKGIIDGINLNDYVLTKDGIVGFIYKIYDNTSVVSLLTNIDKGKSITVEIKNNQDSVFGILSEYDKLKNIFVISELTKNIEIGNEVVTTSFTNPYKNGLLIGNVIRIDEDNNGLSKIAIVKPITDYNKIRNVCVIK